MDNRQHHAQIMSPETRKRYVNSSRIMICCMNESWNVGNMHQYALYCKTFKTFIKGIINVI